ncbi:hypothetical protein [Paenibacillus sp. FSL H7-0331]|nr:hypothetical protein [Paenibacillus sp. FSL H7-0331]
MNEKITLTLIDEAGIQNRYSLIGLEVDDASSVLIYRLKRTQR